MCTSAWTQLIETAKMVKGHELKLKAWIDGQLCVTGEDEWVGVTRYHGTFVKSAPPLPEGAEESTGEAAPVAG
jgi:hypothetical protein